MNLDIQKMRQEQPWTIREWADALGCAAVEGDIVRVLAVYTQQLEGYSDDEVKVMRVFERREIAKLTFGETADAKWKRGQEKIDAGAKINDFGRALAESPLRYSHQLTAYLADHTRPKGVK